jgi:hypothetical protein
MRLVVKEDRELNADPKPKDRATWQRLRVLVEDEACHRDWGCALYRLHRSGRIDNEQREAGDRYAALIRDYRKLWKDPISNIMVLGEIDVNSGLLVPQALAVVAAEAQKNESEFEFKRARRLGDRYKEARAIAGPINSVLEDMLIEDVWPVGERGHTAISHALTRLSHFFNTGTKRKR